MNPIKKIILVAVSTIVLVSSCKATFANSENNSKLDGLRQILSETLAQTNKSEPIPWKQIQEKVTEIANSLETEVGSDSEEVINARLWEASFLRNINKATEARERLENLLQKSEKVLGLDHQTTLLITHQLAMVYGQLGNGSKTQAYLRRTYLGRMKVSGELHAETLLVTKNLIISLDNLNQLDEAEALGRRYLYLTTQKWGDGNSRVAQAKSILANVLIHKGKYDDALVLASSAFSQINTHTIPYFEAGRALASVHSLMGQPKESIHILGDLRAQAKLDLGENSPEYIAIDTDLKVLIANSGYSNSIDESVGVEFSKQPDSSIGSDDFSAIRRLGVLGATSVKNLEYAKGEEYLRRAYELTERYRQEIPDQGTQRTAIQELSHWTEWLISLLIRRGKFEEAFYISDNNRARTLIDSISIFGEEQLLDHDDRQNLNGLKKKIAEYTQSGALAAAKGDFRSSSAYELERTQLSNNLKVLKQKIAKNNPKFEQLLSVKDSHHLESVLNLIPSDTVFIEYWLAENTPHAFVVHDGLIEFVSGQAAIPGGNDIFETYRRVIAGRSLNPGRNDLLWQKEDSSFVLSATKPDNTVKANVEDFRRFFGRRLVGHLKKFLIGKKQLIISPDKELAIIPFDTLILDSKPLVSQFNISYIQSFSMLETLHNRHIRYQQTDRKESMLAIGGVEYQRIVSIGQNIYLQKEKIKFSDLKPMDLEIVRQSLKNNPKNLLGIYGSFITGWHDLPASLDEVQYIENLFKEDVRVLSKDQATENTLLRMNETGELSNYKYLHFSTHGYLSTDEPMLSAIVLNQVNRQGDADGYLTAAELMGYNLRTDLTVISACNTGLGKIIHGEGIMGLPYALYVAGSQNTVVTLWPIRDRESSLFMKRFYKKIHDGFSPKSALTETKREMLMEGFPYEDWGAYVLYGGI